MKELPSPHLEDSQPEDLHLLNQVSAIVEQRYQEPLVAGELEAHSGYLALLIEDKVMKYFEKLVKEQSELIAKHTALLKQYEEVAKGAIKSGNSEIIEHFNNTQVTPSREKIAALNILVQEIRDAADYKLYLNDFAQSILMQDLLAKIQAHFEPKPGVFPSS